MAGKWHLGPAAKIVDHGFDKVFYKNSNRAGVANFDFEGNDFPLKAESTKMYHVDACSAAASAFITQDSKTSRSSFTLLFELPMFRWMLRKNI